MATEAGEISVAVRLRLEKLEADLNRASSLIKRYEERLAAQAERAGQVVTRQAEMLERKMTAAKQKAAKIVGKETIIRDRASDIAAYGTELDRLKAKYNPLWAAAQQYNTALIEIDKAVKVGALSERERTAAIEMSRSALAKQITALARAESATKRYAESFVAKQLITPDRTADVAAYGAELDRLRAKFNPIFAAGRQYKATLDEINMAARVGAISERERANAVSQTKNAFANQIAIMQHGIGVNTAFGASVKLNALQMQNMAFQINDIAVMLASGQNPFIMLMQQGMQISQIFTSALGGATVSLMGALRAFGHSVLRFMTNPLNLAVVAIASVAGTVAFLWKTIAGAGGESSAKMLERHRDLIGEIGERWEEAGRKAEAALKRTGAETEVMTRIALGEAMARAQSEFDKAKDALSGSIIGVLRAMDQAGIGDELTNQLLVLRGQIELGTVNLSELRAVLAEIGLDARASSELLNLLGQSFEKGENAFNMAKDVEALSTALEEIGKAVENAQLDRLIEQASKQIEAAHKARAAFRDMARSSIEFIATQQLQQRVLGKSERETARLTHSFELLVDAQNKGIPITDYVYQQIQEWANAMTDAEMETNRLTRAFEYQQEALDRQIEAADDYIASQRELVVAYNEVIQSSNSFIKEQQDELMILSLVGHEAAIQRAEIELLNEFVEAGAPLTAGLGETIAKLAREQVNAAETTSRLSSALDFQTKMLDEAIAAADRKIASDRAIVEGYNDLISSTQQQIDRQELEIATLDDSAQAAATALEKFDLLNAAKDTGATITPAIEEELAALAAEKAANDILLESLKNSTKSREDAAESYADIIAKGQEFIDNQLLEMQIVGASAQEAARLRHEFELLSAAKAADIALTPAMIAQLEDMAIRMAAAEIETTRLRENLDFTRDSFKGFVTDIIGGLQQGQSAFEIFGNAVLNVLNKLINKMVDDLMDAIFDVNGALGGGGGGGLLSLISTVFGAPGGGAIGAPMNLVPAGVMHRGGRVGSTGTPTRSVPASTFARAPRLHDGLARDEFPAILQRGESVIPKGKSSGGGISITFAPTIDARGSSMTEEQFRAILREQERELGPRIIKTVREAQSRAIL